MNLTSAASPGRYCPDIYKVALSFLKGATLDALHQIMDRGISLPDLFELPESTICAILDRPLPEPFDPYHRSQAMVLAEKEMRFVERHHIRVLFADEQDYPIRLAQIQSPPPVLYMLGKTTLNQPHPVSVVGTRMVSPYGADSTRRITRELAEYFPDLCVVSGLAYGVDCIAHTTALETKVTTLAVVAHGLDTIYPAQHRDLARRIIGAGGAILSQYPSGTRPFRSNFLERNRIVAGISDATIVMESELKGGAMSTARHAFEANRDVFALPGRASDSKSTGCNHLIRTQRAHLITTAADLIEVTGWQPLGIKVEARHRSLFPELDGDARLIYDYLRLEPEPRAIDLIHHHTSIPMSRLMALISDLEFDGVLIRHPGNRLSVAT